MGSDGFGARGGTGDGPSVHRPAVTFGARRASPPARHPAVAWGVRRTQSVTATSGRLGGLLGGCGALLREASKVFSVSRVREPGTAENGTTRLGPEGDRRMPGTRPSCPRRQASPLRPPVRYFTCSAGHGILGPRGARKRRIGDEGRPRPTENGAGHMNHGF
jgi:hypothetical protein